MAKIYELISLAKKKWGEKPDFLALEVWLAKCLGKSKEYLFMEKYAEVPEQIEERFWSGIDRMMEGLPLAQLMGKKEFYGLDFIVNEDVLIPRPESELVVDLARKYMTDKTEYRIVDVGTGSGAILLSLAAVESQVIGLGLEISEQALAVAEQNRMKLGLQDRVTLRKSDLLEGLGDFQPQVIVANLPYIGTEKFNFVAKNVEKYEPAVALFGGSDGLDVYRKMFDQVNQLPTKPEVMIGEFGFGQAEIMVKLLKQKFPNAISREIINDLAGIPRVFVVRY